jgi:hypothetical protein
LRNGQGLANISTDLEVIGDKRTIKNFLSSPSCGLCDALKFRAKLDEFIVKRDTVT